MAIKSHSYEPDVPRGEGFVSRNYFQEGWTNPTPIEDYSNDSLTPWFQMKIEQLSPTSRATLVMALNANKSKPHNMPFTIQDMLPSQENFHEVTNCGAAFRRAGGRRLLSIPLSQSLSDLKNIGVLRLATPEERQFKGMVDGRLNVYVLVYPPIEQWWRERTSRPITLENSVT